MEPGLGCPRANHRAVLRGRSTGAIGFVSIEPPVPLRCATLSPQRGSRTFSTVSISACVTPSNHCAFHSCCLYSRRHLCLCRFRAGLFSRYANLFPKYANLFFSIPTYRATQQPARFDHMHLMKYQILLSLSGPYHFFAAIDQATHCFLLGLFSF